jgi:hypothetical protein
MVGHEFHDATLRGERAIRVFASVELAGRQVFGPIERQLAVAPQLAGGVGEFVEVRRDAPREALAFGMQDRRDVVDAGNGDATGPQQGLQREFHDLLRLADHVGPALAPVQDVERVEADARTLERVPGEIQIAHQLAAVQ